MHNYERYQLNLKHERFQQKLGYSFYQKFVRRYLHYILMSCEKYTPKKYVKNTGDAGTASSDASRESEGDA